MIQKPKLTSTGALTLASLALLLTTAANIPSESVFNYKTGTVEFLTPAIFQKVVTLSDAEGSIEALVKTLRHAELIDAKNRWSGSNSLLVIVGDSIADDGNSLELLSDLSDQALASHGQIVALLGDEEASVLVRSKKVSEKALKFLRSMPLAARVGKWLFCHSGVIPFSHWEEFASRASDVLQAADYSNSLLWAKDSVLLGEIGESRKPIQNWLNANDFFGVVFGHDPEALGLRNRAVISDDQRLIKLDGERPELSAVIFTRPSEMVLLEPIPGDHLVTVNSVSTQFQALTPENNVKLASRVQKSRGFYVAVTNLIKPSSLLVVQLPQTQPTQPKPQVPKVTSEEPQQPEPQLHSSSEMRSFGRGR